MTRRQRAAAKESGMAALERALLRLQAEIADTRTETALAEARLIDPMFARRHG